MPIFVQGRASQALIDRCTALAAALGSQSKIRRAMMVDMADIVRTDHVDMLLRGVDRYGKPRAPLAASTLAQQGRGPGPSLIPQFHNSRFLTNCEVVWLPFGGTPQLVKRFVNILDRKGRPFAQYHLEGAVRPGTAWVLPRRDVGGLTPRGWAALQVRWRQFVQDAAKYGKQV